MGLTLTGEKVKIYAKEKQWSGGSFMTYSAMVSSKDKNGNWTNGFVDVNFKKADADKITNKCKIDIQNAFPTVTESNGRTYVKWFINEFTVVEGGEAPVDPNEFVSIDDSELPDFMKVDDSLGDEAPFR